MNIIAFVGLSGSGKTTAANIFASLLTKGEILKPTSMMFQYARENMEIFKKIFDIDRNIETFEECFQHMNKTMTREKIRELNTVSRSYVEKQMEIRLDELRTQGAEFIIAERENLHEYSIWNIASYRILIEAEEKKRLNHIAQREINRRGYVDTRYINTRSTPSFDVPYEDIHIDYSLINDYNPQFCETVMQLCDKIRFLG